MESKPTNINSSYEIFQTKYAKYQGVWIISRKKWINKIYTNNEQFIIAADIKTENNPHFIIGAYFQQKWKRKILWQLEKLVKRIRLTYINPKIILYWDLNSDKVFNPGLIEKTLKMKYPEMNDSIITREQIRDNTICTSTLDFYFSTQHVNELRRLDKNESDHYPLLAKVQIAGKMIKSKTNITFRRADINKISAKAILSNDQWPTSSWPKTNEYTLWKRNTIRATVKLQQDANEIFKQNIDWSSKQIQIKEALSESFKRYVSGLDLKRRQDTSQFYKIINSLLKYKVRGKIVKGIKCNEE